MLIRAAAEKGDPEAQFLFGVQIMVGDGITRDRLEAVRWLRKAAEAGHAEAQYTLGNLFATPDPEDRLADPVEAEKWLTIAAEQGNLAAISRLSDEEEKRLQSAAENGDPVAIARLGAFLAKNPTKRRYYTQENHRPVDSALTGKGDPVSDDVGEADTANRAGGQPAAPSRQMDEDPAETIRWSLLLSGLRGADAYLLRGFILENGIVVNLDLTAAADCYRKAAGLGDARAQYWLGLMYAEGRGVAKDMVESGAWLSRAARNGSAEATDALAKLDASLPPGLKPAAQRPQENSDLAKKL
jgi:TPR repeat protein